MRAQLIGEGVAEGFDGGLGAEVRTADADDHHQVDVFCQPAVHHAETVGDFVFADRGRQMLPTQEIIACAAFFLENDLCGKRFFYVCLELFLADEGITSR